MRWLKNYEFDYFWTKELLLTFSAMDSFTQERKNLLKCRECLSLAVYICWWRSTQTLIAINVDVSVYQSNWFSSSAQKGLKLSLQIEYTVNPNSLEFNTTWCTKLNNIVVLTLFCETNNKKVIKVYKDLVYM